MCFCVQNEILYPGFLLRVLFCRFLQLFFTGVSWPSCAGQRIARTGRKNARNSGLQIYYVHYLYKSYVHMHRSRLNVFPYLFAAINYAVGQKTAYLMTGTPYCPQSINKILKHAPYIWSCRILIYFPVYRSSIRLQGAVVGGRWRQWVVLVVPVGSCWFLVVRGGSWWFLVVLGGCC